MGFRNMVEGCVTVSCPNLLKTMWEKEKLIVTSKFSFSNSFFYLFKELSSIFSKFEIVVCKLFHFQRVYWYMYTKYGVLTDAHFLHLTCNNREARLPKLMLLHPLGHTFAIMGYKFSNRELLEVTDIKRLNLSCVNKGTHRSSRTIISKLNSEIYPILYFI